MSTEDKEGEAKGFELTQAELKNEGQRAQVNDRGQKNTTSNLSTDSGVYSVSEETRRYGGNPSLQDVALVGQDRQNVNIFDPSNNQYNTAIASLSSTTDEAIVKLIGYNNGEVIVTVYRNDQRFDANITEAAEKAGITAAGIRRTVKDIARDGEVDRGEQIRIIALIDKAKGLAGIR